MIFFLLLFTFITCSENTINTGVDNGDEGKEMVKVPIKLSVEPMKIVGKQNTEPVQRIAHTRTGDWGDNADDAYEVDEDKIQNLWVLQFNSSGNFIYSDYYADVDNMNFASDLTTANNCTLAFVANMGPSAYTTSPANLTEFKKGTVGYHDMIAQIQSDKVLPMVGIKDEVDVPSGVSGGLQVEMKRAVARLDFTYSFSTEMQAVISAGNLGMQEIVVRNIPAKVTYDLSGDSPATSELINITERNIGFASKTGATLYVYLPHNARGVNSGIMKPSDKANEPHATYVSLLTYRTNMTTDLVNDGIEYLTYLGANNTTDFNVNANTKYNITSTIKGALQGDKRVVYRESTSNCYMIPSFMGSSGSTANPEPSVLIPVRRANMSKHLGKQLNDVSTGWSAYVLWRDNTNLSITIDQGSSYKEHGYFKVTASNPWSNAIVAIKDESDNILWSWHIWMPKYSDVKTSYILHNGHKFMASVLGATEFNDDVPPNNNQWYYPCYFQWGRKDPFPGCNGKEDDKLRPIHSGASGSTTINVEGVAWSTSMLSGGNTMRYATRNPMKVMGESNDTTHDWFTNTLGNMDPYLWRTENGEKTVNDPCPMGWRVAYAKRSSKTESDWDISQILSPSGNMNGTNFYYPKPGVIKYESNLSTNNIYTNSLTSYGYFWQNYSKQPAENQVNYLNYYSEYLIKTYYRAVGMAIHCVKIE